MVKTEKNMNSNDIFKSAEEEKKPQNRVISGKEYRTLKNENCSIRYFWTELDTWARKRNGRETFQWWTKQRHSIFRCHLMRIQKRQMMMNFAQTDGQTGGRDDSYIPPPPQKKNQMQIIMWYNKLGELMFSCTDPSTHFFPFCKSRWYHLYY